MAKQERMYWNLDKKTSEIKCTLGKEGESLFSGFLNVLFPDWTDRTDCQQECIAYGMKQKLSDSLARPKDQTLTDAEKRVELSTNWVRITEEEEWNAKPRTLTPLEKEENALARFEKEVEALVDQLKANGASDDLIDSMNESAWEPKRQEFIAKIAELKKSN